MAHTHWSASALFFASILFALAAIISGSQQLWLLPRLGDQPSAREDERLKQTQGVDDLMERLRSTTRPGRLKTRYLFTLQAPLLLLTFSVMTFLGGLCSLVYSPLSRTLKWDDQAKVGDFLTCGGQSLRAFTDRHCIQRLWSCISDDIRQHVFNDIRSVLTTQPPARIKTLIAVQSSFASLISNHWPICRSEWVLLMVYSPSSHQGLALSLSDDQFTLRDLAPPLSSPLLPRLYPRYRLGMTRA